MIFLAKKQLKRFYAGIRAVTDIRKASREYGARILMYHSTGGFPKDHRLGIRVPPSNFEEQMERLIKRGYKCLTVSELIAKLPEIDNERYAAITFDDGYKDNAAFAAQALLRHNLKATFFVSASYIEGEGRKRWADGGLREYMNWDDVAGLGRLGFEIGSHMVHHVDLSSLDENGLKKELMGSKEIISKKTGMPVAVYSLPYGGVSAKVIETAKKSGYIGGCSSISGINHAFTDRYVLRRTEIDGYDTIQDFRHKMLGYYD